MEPEKNLGVVDTLCNTDDEVRVKVEDFVANSKRYTKLKAKSLVTTYFDCPLLKEEMDLDHQHELVRRANQESQNFLESLCQGTQVWPIPQTKTIKFELAFGLWYRHWNNGSHFDFEETFIVDETLWSRVREWLNDLKV